MRDGVPTFAEQKQQDILCIHCGKKKLNRPRGLCWTCYYAPGVKELYPPTSKYARRGVGGDNSSSPLPAEPTDAMPGSEEKIAVLLARAERGESLFHPGDVRHADDTDRRPTAPTHGKVHLPFYLPTLARYLQSAAEYGATNPGGYQGHANDNPI